MGEFDGWDRRCCRQNGWFALEYWAGLTAIYFEIFQVFSSHSQKSKSFAVYFFAAAEKQIQ